jgi:hypothetical protein
MNTKPAKRTRSRKQAPPNLFERIAKASYEATRAWSEVGEDAPRARWEDAEPWRRTSAIAGVKHALLAGRNPEQLHESWRKDRLKRGWTFGEKRNAQAKEDPHLKPFAELGDSKKRKSELFAAVAHTLFKCGKERWNVKTLTDPAAGNVNIDEPQKATVAQLWELPAPVDPIERQPGELTTYKLRGTITLAKLEADKDIHMVLEDGEKTMIIEAVSPDCAESSRVLDQITAVRQKVEEAFPGAAAGGREERLKVPVTVTGVAFFDRPHGQDGVALTNAVELHPVLSFEVAGE